MTRHPSQVELDRVRAGGAVRRSHLEPLQDRQEEHRRAHAADVPLHDAGAEPSRGDPHPNALRHRAHHLDRAGLHNYLHPDLQQGKISLGDGET